MGKCASSEASKGRSAEPPWRLVILAAAAFYAVLSLRLDVGLTGDEPEYILAARELLRGDGFFGKLVDNRRLCGRLPGLPLLLAPFASWAGPPFLLLKLIPLCLTAASCLLLWELLRPWMSPRPRFAVLVLFAFNPLVAGFAGRVMTEPLFTAVALAALVLLRRALRDGRAGAAWGLGALLGWASVIRGEGAVLAAAAAVGLWMGGRRGLLGPVLGAASAVGGFVFLGNWLSRSTPTSYVQVWQGSLPHVSWLRNAAHVARSFVCIGLLGAQGLPGGAAAAGGAVLSVAALAALGLRRLETRVGAGERPVLWAAASFMALYGLTHLFWPVPDPRFVIALLPLVLTALVASGWDGTAAWPRPWLAASLGACLLSYGVTDVRSFLEAPRRAPARTLAWVARETPPSARVWGYFDSGLVQLYTGREGIFLTVPQDADAFRYRLLRERISLLFFSPLRFTLDHLEGVEDIRAGWSRSRAWAETSPEAYEPVYASADESTSVFRVLDSAAFLEAYELYRSAIEELRLARWERGTSLLEEALRKEPRLVSALRAYGATCVITGRDLALGERRLRQALSLRPDDPLARENLRRLLGRRKR